jgi:putative transposase
MPRIARAIAVGSPHHITQRGNYRQVVFTDADDYLRFLEILARCAPRNELDIWAYCLMPNHVHLVAVPQRQDSLARTFHAVQMLYARYVNAKHNTGGHLWQGRFFSCALDERHVYAAVRYVEMNPVRAGLVPVPEAYPWSSAPAHLAGTADPALSGRCFLLETVPDWRSYLENTADADAEKALRKATCSGRPCGQEGFIRKTEAELGRRLRAHPRGRPFRRPVGAAGAPGPRESSEAKGETDGGGQENG